MKPYTQSLQAKKNVPPKRLPVRVECFQQLEFLCSKRSGILVPCGQSRGVVVVVVVVVLIYVQRVQVKLVAL
jgi:hypothetical protein